MYDPSIHPSIRKVGEYKLQIVLICKNCQIESLFYCFLGKDPPKTSAPIVPLKDFGVLGAPAYSPL